MQYKLDTVLDGQGGLPGHSVEAEELSANCCACACEAFFFLLLQGPRVFTAEPSWY